MEAVLQEAGARQDENGRFRLVPEVFSIRYGTWEFLGQGENSPYEVLQEHIPMLQEDCVRALQDSPEDFPVWSQLRKKFGEELAEEFRKARVSFPDTAEQWLDIPVRLDIGLKVDAWREYTLNVTYPAYQWEFYEEENRGLFRHSSIMWLTRRQGYSQAALRNAQHKVQLAVKQPDPLSMIPSPYLYSAAMEIWHELSIFNQLGFFLLVPLREALLMLWMQRWGETKKKWQGAVTLDTKTRCGFFSSSDGSCSLLGIRLEKEVKLPLCDVSIRPDSTLGYSMIGVHGDPSVWKSDLIRRWFLPPQLRREAMKCGAAADVPTGG